MSSLSMRPYEGPIDPLLGHRCEKYADELVDSMTKSLDIQGKPLMLPGFPTFTLWHQYMTLTVREFQETNKEVAEKAVLSFLKKALEKIDVIVLDDRFEDKCLYVPKTIEEARARSRLVDALVLDFKRGVTASIQLIHAKHEQKMLSECKNIVENVISGNGHIYTLDDRFPVLSNHAIIFAGINVAGCSAKIVDILSEIVFMRKARAGIYKKAKDFFCTRLGHKLPLDTKLIICTELMRSLGGVQRTMLRISLASVQPNA